MIMGEKIARNNLLKHAAKAGYYNEVKLLLEYYEGLIAKLPHHREDERKAIAMEGIIKIHNLISPNGGELEIDGIKIK